MPKILEVSNLEVRYAPSAPPVLKGVDFILERGQALGIVGESGSGKSTVLSAILGLLPPGAAVTRGGVLFEGQDTLAISPTERRAMRGGQIAMVFQDPFTCLNPSLRVGLQLTEALIERNGMESRLARVEGLRLMDEVRLPRVQELFDAYPHQLSGGMKQRIVIAMALALSPKLLLLDEPTTALDVTVEAAILDLLAELQRSRELSMVFVSHNLGVVERVCNHISVMHFGTVVESGNANDVLTNPREAYTQRLLASLPRLGAARVRKQKSADAVVSVRDLTLTFGRRRRLGWLASRRSRAAPVAEVKALDAVSFELCRGEILGVVGESGSGKSTLGRCIAGVYRPDHGEVRIDGKDIVDDFGRRSPLDWRKVQMVFQNPDSSLNPRHRIRDIVGRPLAMTGLRGLELEARLKELLELVRLPVTYLQRYPHQLSGGEKQRVGIARALALDPEILVCDEATSALDVTVQAVVLELIESLRDRLGLAIVFITHDLAVVSQISDRVAVMQSGRIVEQGLAAQVLGSPREEYTRRLLASVPRFVREGSALAPVPSDLTLKV
jgi:peptide/nickel transport system ATP-binding protein